MAGWFGSDHDDGKSIREADRERIESTEYGIMDALDDVIRDVTPSTLVETGKGDMPRVVVATIRNDLDGTSFGE